MNSIVDLPYDQRRVIAVVEEPGTPDPQRDGKEKLERILIWAYGAPAVLALEVVAAIKKLRASEGLPVLSGAEARRQLRFPPGHPIAGQVYAGHPLVPERYVPLASFHQVMFLEKVNEFVDLFAALRATRVRVLYREGYRRTTGGNVSVSAGESVGVKGNVAQEQASEVMLVEEYRPSGEPEIPSNLVWFGHETAWQGYAERRIKYRTAKLQAKISYSESFGIDASLKAKVEGIGLDVGGHFTDFQSTTWDVEAEFA